MFRAVVNFNAVRVCSALSMLCAAGVSGMAVGNENILAVMGGNAVVSGAVCHTVINPYIGDRLSSILFQANDRKSECNINTMETRVNRFNILNPAVLHIANVKQLENCPPGFLTPH